MSTVARRAGHAGGLLFVAGLLAVVSGEPFVFPSLGPSAYLLAVRSDGSARRVVGGHAVGVAAGAVAYGSLAAGVAVTDAFQPFDPAVVRLAAASVVAVAATTAGMLLTETRHAPACATTLIVSLGLLSAPRDLVVILLSVGVLYATHLVGVWVGRRSWSAFS
ncbi:MAG: HPP family protein [Halobaculum sp.]